MTYDHHSLNSTESVVTEENEEGFTQSVENEVEEKSVGFWFRFIAYIIDVIIISSINGILLSPLVFLNEGVPVEISLWTLNGLLALVIYYTYFVLLTKLFQQTLGKMIVGIKVIEDDKGLLSWQDVFYREIVGRIIHNVFFILKLLYLVVAFTKEKQGIHDMIGNTRVVYI